MDSTVSIVNTRENALDFDIAIQNVKFSDVAVRFVIEVGSIHYAFPCKHETDDKWTVTIPPLPNIEQVEHPFWFEVIVDGYYFEPHRGTVKIVPEPEVKTSGVHSSPQSPVIDHINVKNDVEDKPTDKKEKPVPTKRKASKAKQPRKAIEPKTKPKPKPKAKTKTTESQVVEPSTAEEEVNFDDLAQQFLDRKQTDQDPVGQEKARRAKQIFREFHKETESRKSDKPTFGEMVESTDPPSDSVSEQDKLVRDILRSVQHKT